MFIIGSCSMEKKEEGTDNKPQYNWRDITDEFIQASSDLQLGELLHDST